MKNKILITILLLFYGLQTTKAQIKFNILTGVNMPSVRSLNDMLQRNGYKELRVVSSFTGLDMAIATDDFIDIHISAFINRQSVYYREPNGVQMSSALISGSVGVKVINKYKKSLEIMAGLGGSTPNILKIRVGNNPTQNTPLFATLSQGGGQVIELEQRGNFYAHFAVKYRFKVAKIYPTLQTGYCAKLSQSKWYLGNVMLSEPVNANPLGFYAGLIFSF